MEQDNSFISLQPPLDRPLNETIQFESIDLYFWTGPQFRTPTILFYLGPICSVNSCNLSVSKINAANLLLLIIIVVMHSLGLFYHTVEERWSH